MDFGLTLLTHGVMTRDDEGDCFLQNISPEDMAPVESAVRAEELGFHSVWFSDHVVTERVTGEGEHPANLSGKRAYPDRPVLLDIPTTIGAIAEPHHDAALLAVGLHRALPPPADHRARVRDARRPLARPRDPRRRRRLGEGRVRRHGLGVRAPRRDHRRVHPDLQARVDRAVDRLPRQVLRHRERLDGSQARPEAAPADLVRRRHPDRGQAAPPGAATASTPCTSTP